MACNVPRQVGATYKSLWTNARKNAEARRLGLPPGPGRDEAHAWSGSETRSGHAQRWIVAASIAVMIADSRRRRHWNPGHRPPAARARPTR